MFRVPTYLARSSIHGIGVFTAVDIPSGTVVWDFDADVDWRLTPDELDEFPEPFRSRLRHYCYLEKDGLYVLCGDNARYMNHSVDPNCDDRGPVTTAKRRIAAGEELTCDYTTFDLESAAAAPEEFGPGRPLEVGAGSRTGASPSRDGGRRRRASGHAQEAEARRTRRRRT